MLVRQLLATLVGLGLYALGRVLPLPGVDYEADVPSEVLDRANLGLSGGGHRPLSEEHGLPGRRARRALRAEKAAFNSQGRHGGCEAFSRISL